MWALRICSLFPITCGDLVGLVQIKNSFSIFMEFVPWNAIVANFNVHYLNLD